MKRLALRSDTPRVVALCPNPRCGRPVIRQSGEAIQVSGSDVVVKAAAAGPEVGATCKHCGTPWYFCMDECAR